MINVPNKIQHLSFVRCKPNSKIPLDKEWQKNPRNYDQIKSHLKNNHNYGILCGYNGTLIIDIDNDETSGISAEENYLNIKEFLPETFTVKTPGGGYHIYFECQDWGHGSSKINDENGNHIGEVRYFGNQTIGPNSIHPDALKPYEVIKDIDIQKIDAQEVSAVLSRYVITAQNRKTELPFENIGIPQDIGKVIEGMRLENRSGELMGAHPVHGSKTGHNFSVNIEKGIWHCYRCESGGNALHLIAVKEGLIECHEAPTALRGEIYKKAKSIAKEKYGIIIDDIRANSVYDDKFNARFFYDLYKDKLLWCASLGGWMYYDGVKWRVDKTEVATRYAIETSDKLIQEALDRDSKSLIIHAKHSGNIGRIQAMTKVAKSLMAKDDSIFDQNDFLFNCKNGTYNLKDDVFVKHSKDDFITKVCGVNYVKDEKCPLWDAFIDKIFCGDKDLINFIQKSIGYAMTASVEEQSFFILYGSGSNGKSTFLETILRIFNEYGMNSTTETFTDSNKTSIPNDIARLRGTRFVTAKETKRRIVLDEPTVKHLTGSDTITARFLNKEFFDFSPTFKIFMATNHKPRITGTDRGIWRRIKLIPFNYSIPKEEEDRKFMDKLRGEMSGILNWIIEGQRKWKAEGLGTAAAVKLTTDDYRDEEDEIGMCIKEECFVDWKETTFISVREFKDLLNDYTGKPYGQKTISEYMKAKGYKPRNNTRIVDRKQVRCYIGIRRMTLYDQFENDPGKDAQPQKELNIDWEK